MKTITRLTYLLLAMLCIAALPPSPVKGLVVINPYAQTPPSGAYDADAQAWFTNFEGAGYTMNATNKAAVSAWVVAQKAAASPKPGVSNWDAYKEVCILAGVSGVDGARIPLKGNIGTKAFFTNSHYSVAGGLTSDGSSTYLNTNRLANADPQDNQAFGVYITNLPGTVALADRFMGTDTGGNASELINGATTNGVNIRARSLNSTLLSGTNSAGTGLVAVSRHQSADFQLRAFGSETTLTATSGTPKTSNYGVFASENGSSKAEVTIILYFVAESLTLSAVESSTATLAAALVP